MKTTEIDFQDLELTTEYEGVFSKIKFTTVRALLEVTAGSVLDVAHFIENVAYALSDRTPLKDLFSTEEKENLRAWFYKYSNR